MDKENKEQGKKCFIITPIGNENSDTFRRAKGVIESVIKPVLTVYGFDDIKPAYEINVSGMINTQIINRIIDDDLIIANLTGNNPNVMYELCLRHVVAKPIIHICEKGTSLPFDIKDNRTIFYENDMLGVEELKNNMSKFMDEMVYNVDCMDNPIYNAYRYGKLLKETQGTEKNEMLNLLVEIYGKVSEIKTGNQSPFVLSGINTNMLPISSQLFWLPKEAEENLELNERDIKKAKELLDINWKGKYKVYELAKEMDISSKKLLKIASEIGIAVKVAQSSLESNDIREILEYISKAKV